MKSSEILCSCAGAHYFCDKVQWTSSFCDPLCQERGRKSAKGKRGERGGGGGGESLGPNDY